MKSCLLDILRITLLACLLVAPVRAEDIDIFAGTKEVDSSLPNVIFILDNTSNWSRLSQKWPGGLAQGQSEVRAIKSALSDKVGEINVGILEFTTDGTANENGAYVRFNLQEFTSSAKAELDDVIDKIFDDINTPEEKRNSNAEYGNLMYDFYNYLDGAAQSFAGGGTPSGLADTDAYETAYSEFRSPLQTANACADTYLIFIGNPNSSGPSDDSEANSRALAALYDAAGASVPNILAGNVGAVGDNTPLSLPEFTTTVIEEPGTPVGTGYSSSCWKVTEKLQCTIAENQTGGLCDGEENCSCTEVSTNNTGCVTSGNPKNRTTRWKVATGASTVLEVELSDQEDETGGAAFNLDDWAKFLHNYGVPFSVVEDGETLSERVYVTTYTIDVFNAQQNAETSSLYYKAAKVGGGRYFQARSEEAIATAINSALGDILADSTSFAAVTLPLSATNRAQVDNQVYIGMFRPYPGKKPRWYGNLKRYQLALFDGEPRLADVNLYTAIVQGEGILRDCAQSFWSEDSNDYWEDLGIQPALASECRDPDVTTSDWSDIPDGPTVEKGGAGQMVRQFSDSSSRTLYTVGDSGLRALADTDATALGGQTILDYLRGDEEGVDEVMPAAGLRASVHGDIVHSRPLSVRFDADTVKLFFGTNDGMFRSVDASNGNEDWAMVVPEHYDRIARLYNNSPLVRYTGALEEVGVTHELKDYFFDGPTGDLVVYSDMGVLEKAYIFPTMRRGGRMVYALDVTDPDAAPSLLWRQGCPNLDNNTDCTAGFTDIGQTWSTPISGLAAGYLDDADEPKHIVLFGGGFDDCLNEDAAPYPSACSSANGKGIYVLDAATGATLAKFNTDAPVISELAPVDIDFDGTLDFAYAVDVTGGIYRVNFAELGSANPESSVTALESDDWTIYKIGSSSASDKRFFNSPVVGAFQGTVFVAVGSGDRERPLDINYPYVADVQNRFYSLIDRPYLTFVEDPDGDLEPDEYTTVDLNGSDMLAVVETTPPVDGEEPATPASLRDYRGWYMDLSDRGEQVFNSAAIAGGKVFFNTLQPGAAETGLCARPKGIGTGYSVNLFDPEFTEGTRIASENPPIPPVIATLKVPPGLPDCDGVDCPSPPEDPCASGDCEVVTVCIGCEGFEPIEIIPDAPPIRQRLYYIEDVDRVD